MKPIIKDGIKIFASRYKGILNVAAIDCGKQKKMCTEYKVDRVPTLKIFLEDKSKGPVEFRNRITLQNLEKEVIPRLENHVIKVGHSNVEELKKRAKQENKHIFLVYPTKRSTSPIFMSLSTVASPDFSFSKI